MLKALELIGFKSFADATRFDFPDGITVVVGPNGSGKSNIVDAIKWVLGSQSAKSLRGGDMSDVIFKGSSATGRKPANSAEATLVLDNTSRTLEVQADEVTVTRRVYRSGESEYLINRQPCRLRDVKDLFRGTGVGVDAYSLIEQGKVDRMLQASPKDRRAIFEEAAGISRFKAKKVEAERRLHRVNQNLLRLSDIVDEVHGRLISIKSQASKAARYREMTDRLSVLRKQVGVAEFVELQTNEGTLLEQIELARASVADKQSELTAAQTVVSENKRAYSELTNSLNETQSKQQAIENQRATLNAELRAHRQRFAELVDEKASLQEQCLTLQEKADLTHDQIANRQSDLRSLAESKNAHEIEVASAAAALLTLEQRRVEIDRQQESLRQQIDDLHRDELSLQSQLQSLQTKIVETGEKRSRLEQSIETANQARDLLAQSLAELQQQLAVAQQDESTAENGLVEAKVRLENCRQILRTEQDNAIVLQSRYQSLEERLDLLQQLDRDNTGLGDGARQLIEFAREKPFAPWNTIQGIVADLIEVEVHLAPLIDVSLAHLSEAVVLTDGQLIDRLQTKKFHIEGRATLLRLDRMPSRRAGDRIQLDGLRGVIGRADRLVHFQEAYQPLVQFLLGTTWLVDSLQTAMDLSHYRGSGLRFVTAACERIDTDGTIHIGTLQTLSGILTRRSEIHAATHDHDGLEQLMFASSKNADALQVNVDKAAQLLETAEERRLQATRRYEAVNYQVQSVATEVVAMDKQILSLKADLDDSQAALILFEEQTDALKRDLLDNSAQRDDLATQLAASRDALTEHRLLHAAANEHLSQCRIADAKLEHRLGSEQTLLDVMLSDRDERVSHLRRCEQKISELAQKIDLADGTIVTSADQLESLAAELEAIIGQRKTLEEQLQTHREVLQSSESIFVAMEKSLAALTGKIDELQLASVQNAQRRDALTQHYLAEYEIDLTSQNAEAMALEMVEDRGLANVEISRLRAEIVTVGSVNMEALAELDDLQSRYDALNAHLVDLTTARDSLLKIIERIEGKSREMFLETLEAIRTNFQTLYRRSFGGGSADIILEDPNDVLNCGVEVIATPPGKIALSNSLLSGGEKALTAVALIMSIFQFRPSPFCILDEVDAPFDEANIGRFVNVLKEFLHMTKFIVVSHSKKTMTVANTIYGVTMQESGVSRQVSVRFEEVGDDGEILKAA